MSPFLLCVFTKDGLGREARPCVPSVLGRPQSPPCSVLCLRGFRMRWDFAVDPSCLWHSVRTHFYLVPCTGVFCSSHDEAGALGRGLPVGPEASPCLMATLPWLLSRFCSQETL